MKKDEIEVGEVYYIDGEKPVRVLALSAPLEWLDARLHAHVPLGIVLTSAERLTKHDAR